MKNLIFILTFIFLSISSLAQVPQKMSYQAIVRDGSGDLVSSSLVGIQISILETSSTGTAVYVETHTPMTNSNGLVSLEIGTGTLLSGDFSAIDWGGDQHFIQMDIDPLGGTSYTISGVSQLLSVPYAFHALTAQDSDNTLDQAYNKEQTTFPAIRDINVDDGAIRIIATDNEGLIIESDPDSPGLSVFGVGNAGALDISNINNNNGDGLDFLNNSDGEGIDLDNLGDGNALDIDNDDDGHALAIDNSDDGNAIIINNSGNSDAQVVSQSGNARVFKADHSGAGGIGIELNITSGLNPDNAVQIHNDGLGSAISVDNDNSGDAVSIDNNDGQGGDALTILNDGGGDGIYLENKGDGRGIAISNVGTEVGLYVDHTGDENAVLIGVEGAGNGLSMINDGTGIGVNLHQKNPANAENVIFVENDGLSQAVLIQNDSPMGGGLEVWNSNAINITPVVYIENASKGDALNIDNSTAINGNAIQVAHAGDSVAVEIKNVGVEKSLQVIHKNIANANEAVKVDNAGTSNAISVINGNMGNAAEAVKIENAGSGKALLVTNLNPASVSDAVLLENGGKGRAMVVTNGNPDNVSAVMSVENGALGTGLEVINADPSNISDVIFGSTIGEGAVASMLTEDNDINVESTVIAVNQAAGSAGLFITEDNPTGKVNSEPTVAVVSTGKGAGIFALVENHSLGSDTNSEPVILARHEGYGPGILVSIDEAANSSVGLEVLNSGSGKAVHIESFLPGGAASETALHVEHSNSSAVPFDGYAAHFEQHSASTSSSAAVVMNSASTDPEHSTLVVIPSTTDQMAATFEGKVEIAGDLETVGFMYAPYAEIAEIYVPTSAVIGDLTASTASTTVAFSTPMATVGDLVVTSSISAPAKAFKIDHPLDPENKYLLHNSIESNERLNIYSGNITTNEEGYATVILPYYMSALNANFRYQLTILDQSFAQAIIWEEFEAATNSFIIKTNEPEIKVSWQMSGARIDTWAIENPLEIEVDKVHID